MNTTKELINELNRKKKLLWKNNTELINNNFNAFELMREIGTIQGRIKSVEEFNVLNNARIKLLMRKLFDGAFSDAEDNLRICLEGAQSLANNVMSGMFDDVIEKEMK